MGALFFVISGINILAAIFYKIFIPQTRNKTISELQKIFAKDPKIPTEAYTYDNPLHRTDTDVFEWEKQLNAKNIYISISYFVIEF